MSCVPLITDVNAFLQTSVPSQRASDLHMRDTSKHASDTCYYASDWTAYKGYVTVLVGLRMWTSIDAQRNCSSVVEKTSQYREGGVGGLSVVSSQPWS